MMGSEKGEANAIIAARVSAASEMHMVRQNCLNAHLDCDALYKKVLAKPGQSLLDRILRLLSYEQVQPRQKQWAMHTALWALRKLEALWSKQIHRIEAEIGPRDKAVSIRELSTGRQTDELWKLGAARSDDEMIELMLVHSHAEPTQIRRSLQSRFDASQTQRIKDVEADIHRNQKQLEEIADQADVKVIQGKQAIDHLNKQLENLKHGASTLE
ncbi:MAG: hypothetical protein VXZ78_01255, partial [Pseudomonadota bacterium]|nr:hypothetical protein [Pseudomonadota bacterium]